MQPTLVEYFDDRYYKLNVRGVDEYLPSTTTILGITSKPFLAKWRGDIGNREADMRMNEGAERGSRIHNAWSVYVQGGAVIFNPYRNGFPKYSYDEIDELNVKFCGVTAQLSNQDEMYQMTKLASWMEIIKPERVLSEQIVYSISNKRAGTADNFMAIKAGKYQVNGKTPVELKGGLYCVDLKSGKAVDDDAFMQVSDYTHMLVEMAYSGVDWAAQLLKDYGEPAGALILHTGSQVRSGIEGLATLLRTKEELAQDYEDMQHAHKLWLRKNKDAKPTVFEFPSLLTMKKEE